MRPRSLASLLILALVTAAIGEERHLKYLPSDTRAVLTIHFPALGEVDRKEGLELFEQLYRTHLAPELGKDARLPLSDVERVVVAMPYAGSFNGIILVTGKLDRSQLDRQMQQVAKASAALTVERMGRPSVPVYTRKLDEKALLDLVPPLEKVPPRFRRLVAPYEAHVAALDDRTLGVSLSGKKQIERALRNRDAAKMRVGDELAAVLKKQNAKDVTAGVLVDDALHPGLALIANDEMRETFQQFDHATMRIVSGKDVQFIIDIKAKTTDLAPMLEDKVKRGIEGLRGLLPTLFPNKTKQGVMEQLLKSFVVTRKDDRLTLSGKVPESEWGKMRTPPPK